MYLIADATEYELPLAVADTQAELARMCGSYPSVVCRAIKEPRKTRIFHGIPARIYKIPDEEENADEQPDVNPQSAEISRAV